MFSSQGKDDSETAEITLSDRLSQRRVAAADDVASLHGYTLVEERHSTESETANNGEALSSTISWRTCYLE